MVLLKLYIHKERDGTHKVYYVEIDGKLDTKGLDYEELRDKREITAVRLLREQGWKLLQIIPATYKGEYFEAFKEIWMEKESSKGSIHDSVDGEEEE